MAAASPHELILMLVRRAIRGNFQLERASEGERNVLSAAATPIKSPLGQDYAAWRRAVLLLGAILLGLAALLALLEHSDSTEQLTSAQETALAAQGEQLFFAPNREQLREQVIQGFGAQNLELLDELQEMLLLTKLLVALLAGLAAFWWSRLRRSRSLARWAWLMALVVPLAIAAWPWGQSLDFSHLDQQGVAGGNTGALIKQQIAAAIAVSLLATVAPKLLALFPGILRSSLALKTLLPEAAAPGWLAVLFSPFLAGFLLLLLCLLSQLQGSWVLLGAIGGLCIGPMIFVQKAAVLVRPYGDAEVGPAIGGIRRQAAACNSIGVVLLLYYLFTFPGLGWLQVLHLVLEAGGGIFLAMVAISDITLALLAFSQQQGADFHGSALRAAYETRLQQLAEAGLTDVESALGVKDLEQLRRAGSSKDNDPKNSG